ncbi:MAG TPA: hypothetical protein VNN22_21860 [Verrucomicrobiae bacterium]|nr:hypothetical protein [Verrucomicrobiae bacterium]
MNCGHHNLFPFSDNELICTAYSPGRAGNPAANNGNQLFKQRRFSFAPENYSPRSPNPNRRGEQVLFVMFEKYSLDRKILQAQNFHYMHPEYAINSRR